MKYYDEMHDKYGFGDGGNTPPQAWLARDIYVTAINHFAAKRGSRVRLIRYDRPGMHNGCMVLLVAESDLHLFVRPDGELLICDWPAGFEPADPDEAFGLAVDDANEMELDDYLHVSVVADMENLVQDLEQWELS